MEDKHEKDQSSKDNKKSENKWVTSIFGTGIFVAIFGFSGWLIYKYTSEEGMNLLLASCFFAGFVSLFYVHMKESVSLGNVEKTFAWILILFPAIFIMSPVLFFLFKLILLIFCNWYYVLSLYLIIALLVVYRAINKTSFRIIAIVLVALSIYFGYKARNIIDIKFSVLYDNERIM